jgi:hypothetical protein
MSMSLESFLFWVLILSQRVLLEPRGIHKAMGVYHLNLATAKMVCASSDLEFLSHSFHRVPSEPHTHWIMVLWLLGGC